MTQMLLPTLWTVEGSDCEWHKTFGVFEREADALKWKAALEADENVFGNDCLYVSTIPFVRPFIEPYKVTTYVANLDLWDDGRIEPPDSGGDGRWERTEFAIESQPPLKPTIRYCRAPCHYRKGGRIEVSASSAELRESVLAAKISAWRAGTWAGKGHKEINEVWEAQ